MFPWLDVLLLLLLLQMDVEATICDDTNVDVEEGEITTVADAGP